MRILFSSLIKRTFNLVSLGLSLVMLTLTSGTRLEMSNILPNITSCYIEYQFLHDKIIHYTLAKNITTCL